jgi:hypothetical protein
VKDVHRHRLRHTYQKLGAGTLIRLPGTLTTGDVVHVLCDDPPPIVTTAYAMYDTVPVPGRRGITRFDGYPPYELDIPVQWENFDDGDGRGIERDIATIERMCGVGLYAGARLGAPSVVRISVTDDYGNIVPLISPTYQWVSPGGSNITWRITNIAWDATPSRTKRPTSRAGDDPGGRRIRQKAVIHVQEFTPIIVVTSSATTRSVQRNTKKTAAKKAAGKK